jgi:hydrogenase maturation factor
MCLAVPGKIIEIDDSSDLERSGTINFGALNKKANLAFVPESLEEEEH